MRKSYLAFDLGAESGRGVKAEFDGQTISLSEVGRFSTARTIGKADSDGVHRWDLPGISSEMHAILADVETTSSESLFGVAVDTWGVDFALIDHAGKRLEDPVWYRDPSHVRSKDQMVKEFTGETLWNHSGIQLMPFNTLFQINALQQRDPSLLQRADRLLFMPDLLASELSTTPLKSSELTIASTSALLNPLNHTWNIELLSMADLPSQYLQPIVQPGASFGTTFNGTPIYAAAGHDTASAVAAVPASIDTTWAFISSGTWSLMGVEQSKPELSLAAYQLGLSNEVGIEGTTRLLKNIMGLWLVQECRRSLSMKGTDYSYEELTALAASAGARGPLVDASDQRFLAPQDMPTEIRNACRDTYQDPPETVAALVRCALDSLALAYRRTLSDLEQLLQIRFDAVHIVGGGSKNKFLNQLTADACGIPVIAGPSEATAAGNALSQLIGSGAVSSWAEARRVCRNSFRPETFYPVADEQAIWVERDHNFSSP